MDKQTLLSEVNTFDELTKEERMEIDAISEMIKAGKGEGILSPEHKGWAFIYIEKRADPIVTYKSGRKAVHSGYFKGWESIQGDLRTHFNG